MAKQKLLAGRGAHRRPAQPIKGKSPREGGPTLADRVHALEAKLDCSVQWRNPEDGKFIAFVDDPDGDRLSGTGKTRAQAFEALKAKLDKGGR